MQKNVQLEYVLVFAGIFFQEEVFDFIWRITVFVDYFSSINSMASESDPSHALEYRGRKGDNFSYVAITRDLLDQQAGCKFPYNLAAEAGCK